jgi:putative transposase
MTERKAMINKTHELAVTSQCLLLALKRSTVYYEAQGISIEDSVLMRQIDDIHLQYPFYGSRRIRDKFEDLGIKINRKRIQRLMRLMGLEALYPKKQTSKPGKGHTIYPYLLKGLNIERPNQVWAADITYIPMAKGFLYLVAIIDLYSRKALSWQLSNTQDTSFCIEALEQAIALYGRPEIFNTDQGAQFTSHDFSDVLKYHEITISMDGKGRWMDNVFVERLWRSLKYEEVYLKAYQTASEAKAGINDWFRLYNTERRHQALDRKTPDNVYFNGISIRNAA